MSRVSSLRFAFAVSFGFLMMACSVANEENAGTNQEPAKAVIAPLDTHEFLVQFHKDPKRILNAQLPRRDESGKIVVPESLFSDHDVNSKQYRLYKDEIRRQFCLRAGIDCDGGKQGSATTFAEAADQIPVDKFLYNPRIFKKPAEMENEKLLHHTLQNGPWSDSFWPVNKGLIGRRFADPGYPGVKDWSTNYNYIQAVPAWTVSSDRMSPAEKYDKLVGDSAWTLTSRVWAKGQRYIKTYGFVPSWTGLCHGWSPASIMFARPMKSITLPAYNGGSVTFSPSDIKALASELWGEAPPIVKFLGHRCKKFHPDNDDVGRTTNENCFDVNPGSFHIAIVNQLSQSKRGFVMDSTWDFQVWNYPLYAYQYHYFNPQTLVVSQSMAGMTIPIERYSIDKFKKYRSPKVKSVVGVAMDVTYVIPTQPSTKPIEKDKHHTVRYIYDLELDETGTIIGGEWYSNFHPDFIWNPWPEQRALSKVEKEIETPLQWDGTGAVSKEISAAAKRSSARTEPLAVIVENLVKLTAGEKDPADGSTAEPEPEVDETTTNDSEVDTGDDVGPVPPAAHGS